MFFSQSQAGGGGWRNYICPQKPMLPNKCHFTIKHSKVDMGGDDEEATHDVTYGLTNEYLKYLQQLNIVSEEFNKFEYKTRYDFHSSLNKNEQQLDVPEACITSFKNKFLQKYGFVDAGCAKGNLHTDYVKEDAEKAAAKMAKVKAEAAEAAAKAEAAEAEAAEAEAAEAEAAEAEAAEEAAAKAAAAKAAAAEAEVAKLKAEAEVAKVKAEEAKKAAWAAAKVAEATEAAVKEAAAKR